MRRRILGTVLTTRRHETRDQSPGSEKRQMLKLHTLPEPRRSKVKKTEEPSQGTPKVRATIVRHPGSAAGGLTSATRCGQFSAGTLRHTHGGKYFTLGRMDPRHSIEVSLLGAHSHTHRVALSSKNQCNSQIKTLKYPLKSMTSSEASQSRPNNHHFDNKEKMRIEDQPG